MILWKGYSLLDNQPIVVIATTGSKNSKTGDMVQTWILRDDIAPNQAVKTGEDYSVCGDCKHRGQSCYVKTFQAPRSVWAKYQRGGYQFAPSLQDVGRGKHVRVGSYGDPAAVPFEVWGQLLQYASGHTGYTHQWRNCDPRLARIVMASVDTPKERDEARAMLWRTFRIRMHDEGLALLEVVCPASDEAGHKVTCEQCGACDGLNRNLKSSIAILAHGATAKRYVEFRTNNPGV